MDPIVTGPSDQPPQGTSRRPGHRRRRAPGLVVLGLVITGAIVAGVLFYDRQQHNTGHSNAAGSSGGAPAAPSRNIAQVELFMLRGTPDDPQDLPKTIDGNPVTYWHSDYYGTATFGDLYPGLGLEIQLKKPSDLHHLVVTSSTLGWSAQTYTSATEVTSGPNRLAAWGTPTATRTGINGSATFSLSGRRGQWVLLWLTNLGQSIQTSFGHKYQARIDELSVS